MAVCGADPERNACEFGRFFATTPPDLISDGIYKTIAVAFMPGVHRQISVRLCAVSLGAKEVRGKPKKSSSASTAAKAKTTAGKQAAPVKEPGTEHRV